MQKINFLDALPKPVKVQLSAIMMAQILGGFFVILILVTLFVWYQKSNLESRHAKLQASEKKLQKTLDDLTRKYPKVAINESLKAEMAALKERIASQKNIIEIFKQQQTQKQFSGYLIALARQTPKDIWLTKININHADKYITIIGNTIDPNLIPIFIKNINSEPIFDGENFKTFKVTPQKIDKEEEKKTTTSKKEKKEAEPKSTTPNKPKYITFILSTLTEDEFEETLEDE